MLDALVRFATSFVLNGWTYYFLIAGVIIGIVYHFGGRDE